MDELDGKLRSRLEALAHAVPEAAERTRVAQPSRSAIRSGFAGLPAVVTATGAALVVGLAIVLAGRGGSPADVSSALATSPVGTVTGAATASLSPAATPTPAPATRPPAGAALPYPDGCPAYGLSPRRCAYISAWALAQAGLTADSASIELLGDPACEGKPAGCVTLRTMAFVVRIRVTPDSGLSTDYPVFCGVGGDASMLCTDTPVIRVSTPISGYHDVPCGPVPGGEPGSHCATPLPTVAPAAAERAVQLRLPSLTIVIDHAGTYAIDLGDAVLPNGILSDATATLADDRRSDVLIPMGIQLQVLAADGKPLENAYAQGWRSGTQTVHVRRVFTVESFDRGATLEITDVAVR